MVQFSFTRSRQGGKQGVGGTLRKSRKRAEQEAVDKAGEQTFALAKG